MSLSPVDPMRETSQVSMFLVLISEVLRGCHSDKNKGAQETTPEDLPPRWRLTGLVPPGGPSSPPVYPGPSVSPHLQAGCRGVGRSWDRSPHLSAGPGAPPARGGEVFTRARSSAGLTGLP